MPSFAEQLTAARKAAGMTQEELSAVIHVARNTISNWEHGRTEPDLETLRQLSQVLNVDFMSGESAQQNNDVSPMPADNAADSQQAPSGNRKKCLIAIGCLALVLIVTGVVLLILHNAKMAKTAEITLTAEENPAPMIADPEFWGTGLGWNFCFIIRNNSDVPFTPKQAVLIFYEDDNSVVTSATLDSATLRAYMYGDTITNRDPEAVYLRDGANYPKGTRVNFILQGTDANGHELEYSATIALSQEKPAENHS